MAGERIVMIEDDKEMIALGELVLTKHGYVVLSATSGQAGLNLLREQQADLVLLDIMMDGMDGWEVLERIRSDERLSRTPVVMMTARHYLEDEQATTRHAGQYVGYIVKPFIVQELVQQVEQVLAAHSRS